MDRGRMVAEGLEKNMFLERIGLEKC